MHKYLLLAMVAGYLPAADIKGTVVENQTGHAVARATVSLEPVAGSPGARRSGRTNINGFFEFPGLPAGDYFLTAARTGFATVEYGQKQWKSAGVPVKLAENDTTTLTFRLPRFGAITGTVLDENDVGLPDHDVVAYRNALPPQSVGRGRTDDRGMFRISGLEPGSYLVRSAGKQYDDGSYVPTFSRESQTVDQAFPVQVEMDQQVERADVRPLSGRLFTLTVSVVPVTTEPAQNPPNPLPVTITLASELGRETAEGTYHRFGPLPPGEYELFSQAPLDGRPGSQGDYRKFILSKDTELKFVLREDFESTFSFVGAPAAANSGSIRVLARRKDLAGPSAVEVLKLNNNRVRLAPGPWQFALQPNPTFYATAFSARGTVRPNDGRADGWNDANSVGQLQFTISGSPGTVHGTVKSGTEPAIGAPVFLEPSELDPLRRVAETSVTHTDINGQYRFVGLAPGNYRVMSSFEYKVADSAIMSSSGAKTVRVEEAHDAQQDLDLYSIP